MNLSKYDKGVIVRAIMQDVPPIDKGARATAVKAAIVKAMSPAVRKLYTTHPTALRTKSVAYTNPFRHWGDDVIVGDVSNEEIAKIIKPFEAQEEARAAMEHKLRGAFEGIRTLKAAIKAFPEFEKYYPTEAKPISNLPALANVAADLSKLGWPKDKTKEKTNA